MKLELNENELTIMGIKFDNIKDFKSVWYALSTNIIEGWIPSTSDVLELKIKLPLFQKNMSRNKYEEYTYIDYDNIYTYPSTNILINKFNINSLEELKNKEYSLVASKILELYLQPILVNSIDDIYKESKSPKF